IPSKALISDKSHKSLVLSIERGDILKFNFKDFSEGIMSPGAKEISTNNAVIYELPVKSSIVLLPIKFKLNIQRRNLTTTMELPHNKEIQKLEVDSTSLSTYNPPVLDTKTTLSAGTKIESFTSQIRKTTTTAPEKTTLITKKATDLAGDQVNEIQQEGKNQSHMNYITYLPATTVIPRRAHTSYFVLEIKESKHPTSQNRPMRKVSLNDFQMNNFDGNEASKQITIFLSYKNIYFEIIEGSNTVTFSKNTHITKTNEGSVKPILSPKDNVSLKVLGSISLKLPITGNENSIWASLTIPSKALISEKSHKSIVLSMKRGEMLKFHFNDFSEGILPPGSNKIYSDESVIYVLPNKSKIIFLPIKFKLNTNVEYLKIPMEQTQIKTKPKLSDDSTSKSLTTLNSPSTPDLLQKDLYLNNTNSGVYEEQSHLIEIRKKHPLISPDSLGKTEKESHRKYEKIKSKEISTTHEDTLESKDGTPCGPGKEFKYLDGYCLRIPPVFGEERLKLNWMEAVKYCFVNKAFPFTPNTGNKYQTLLKAKAILDSAAEKSSPNGRYDGRMWIPAKYSTLNQVLKWYDGEDVTGSGLELHINNSHAVHQQPLACVLISKDEENKAIIEDCSDNHVAQMVCQFV
ncbi:unnamed protein product, partial [Meganyctiphanes norvegica]